MADFTANINKSYWTIIAPNRTNRPNGQDHPVVAHPPRCPFCTGNEGDTPPEIDRLGSGIANMPGWHVRVVPNKYPISTIHEVIIHSPNHHAQIDHMNHDDALALFTMYKRRWQAHQANGRVFLFCNNGQHAGASLPHPHSQLVVLPEDIPANSLPLEALANEIFQTDRLTAFCPAFSQWPFECWVTTKSQQGVFGDIDQETLHELTRLMQRLLESVRHIHSDPVGLALHHGHPFGYNFYISHTAPWFVRIIPRFIHQAGFEMASGLSVNSVPPEEAAEAYRVRLKK